MFIYSLKKKKREGKINILFFFLFPCDIYSYAANMSSEGLESCDMPTHHATGLGRGQLLTPGFGRGRLASAYAGNVGGLSVLPPLEPVASSTPRPNTHVDSDDRPITVGMLGGLITDLAKQTGDSISSAVNATPQPLQFTSPQSQYLNDCNQSQVKVVVQSDAKPPPYFEGNHKDVFPISEWEDMMKCYLQRVNCNTHDERFTLLMSRLTGRARDVVKVSLRCRPELRGGERVSVVFSTLKTNFSNLTFSNLPMKDFYSTVPRSGEDAMDYWIRLNKAMDAAVERLHG